MSLDTSRLEKYRSQGGDHIARCPACVLTGGDTAGDHLFINADGKFGCVLHQGESGDAHRAEIFNLVGIKSAAKEKSIWTALSSAPENAPAPSLNHFELGTPSAHWIYRTNDGRIAGITVRFETAKGKETRPMAWCKDQHGNTEWRWKAQLEPRTIYGLPFTEDFVVIVEGEKTAEAVTSAGLPVTTWQGGSSTVTKSDWSPLAGKTVVIWPDNDDPGRRALASLIHVLTPIAAGIKIVPIPADMPEGWDAADTTTAEIRGLVDKAILIDPADFPQPESQPDAKQDAKTSDIVRGVMDYPTEVPPETVLLGDGWGRWGDVLTFISTAGSGKSVAMIQAAIAWGLGLPYMGIHPARPLRILLFSGEDDGATIGQCREGFLKHSEAITRRQLTTADLEPLDKMLRTEFSREHVGDRFHAHLDRLLTEEPADLVMVNPMLSYVGGEIVACASGWLRGGIMPILKKHDCASLIAHHTGKMAKDGWDNTDDTYAAIGGGEMGNVPRAILTLRPTTADGLSVLKVAKRPTTGWKDSNGEFTTSFFLRRSGDPTRPAWIPVDSDEAQELIAAGKPSGSGGKSAKKVTSAHVIDALKAGPTQRQTLIERLRKNCQCSEKPAKDAIGVAEYDELISSFKEPNPRGGNAIKWLCLPEHKTNG